MNEINIFFVNLIQPGTLIRGVKVGFTLNGEEKEAYIDTNKKMTDEELEKIIDEAIKEGIKFKNWED